MESMRSTCISLFESSKETSYPDNDTNFHPPNEAQFSHYNFDSIKFIQFETYQNTLSSKSKKPISSKPKSFQNIQKGNSGFRLLGSKRKKISK